MVSYKTRVVELPDLAQQNPWWRNPKALEEDLTLRELYGQEVRWSPRLFHRFQLSRDRVYTLRGPRQVGKTTLAKLLIQDLIQDRGVDPRAVLYYSCDLVRDSRDLADVVETFLRWQAPFELPRRYLFLDEVSSVKEWGVAFRALANRGHLLSTTAVLTGSHALDVARQVERLPGRRGEANRPEREDPLDKVQLPMKFSEYAETLDEEVRMVLISAGLLDDQERLARFDDLFEGRGSAAWSSILALQGPLQRLLQDYLLTGGFPRPLNDLRRRERIERETYELYVRAVTGDLARWGLDERTARELLAATADRLGTPFSWRTLARETDIGSHNTVSRYVQALEQSYVLQTVYHYDRRRKRRAPRKDRKLYVSDPFMFHALRGWASGLPDPFKEAKAFLEDPKQRGPLLEAVLADHLARLAFAALPSSLFEAYEHVFYWRSRKGWEVDFVVRPGSRTRALQVTTTRPRTETSRALRSFGGGLVVTETGERTSVPLACILLLI
ncbi:MAG: ATP-binding protein [Thermoplasmata archaeon]